MFTGSCTCHTLFERGLELCDLEPSWPHKSQYSLLTLATRWPRAAFDHTLMWRCDVMATSCCPRRLSTCRTIAVTIIVSRLSGSLLPAAATCRRTMNNTWGCERKHFEGRLKGHQLPSIQPRTRSLSCQCSATEWHQPDNHQPSHNPLYLLPAFSLSSISPHNTFLFVSN